MISGLEMVSKQVMLITKNCSETSSNKEKPILIVIANDEEQIIQKTLHDLLEKQGYQIIETDQ